LQCSARGYNVFLVAIAAQTVFLVNFTGITGNTFPPSVNTSSYKRIGNFYAETLVIKFPNLVHGGEVLMNGK
jgi:hypothetical protein